MFFNILSVFTRLFELLNYLSIRLIHVASNLISIIGKWLVLAPDLKLYDFASLYL